MHRTRFLLAIIGSLVLHVLILMWEGQPGERSLGITKFFAKIKHGALQQANTATVTAVQKSNRFEETTPRKKHDQLVTPARSTEDGWPLFLHPSDLDVLPEPLGGYPELVVLDRESLPPGRVLIEVWLNHEGIVLQVNDIESTAPAYVVADAIGNILKLKFSPGILAGNPVSVKFRLELQYQSPGIDDIPNDETLNPSVDEGITR